MFFSARVNPASNDPRRAREGAVATAAKLLREMPTAPADPEDPNKPWGTALVENDAVELPPTHCAFRGCTWTGVDESELLNHVCVAHGDVVQPIAD
eukprot:5881579-Pyramimonas_sp.AAC.1